MKIAKSKGCDIRIYEFGIKLDPECREPAGNQIKLARHLYNDLIAAIRAIVDEMQAFILDHAGPEARELNDEIDRLTDAFLAARAAQDEEQMKAAAEERHAKRLHLWQLLAVTRKEYKAAINEQFLSRIGKRTECVTYKARCDAVAKGLGWATANEILDNALDAFKKTFVKGRAPNFARGSEKTQDTLTLQFTAAGGVPAEKILSSNAGEFYLAQPKQGRHGEFRFRLGAAKDDQWATGTWTKSREVPADASIGIARLVRRRIGKDLKYWIQVQAKLPEQDTPEYRPKKPLVTLHLGWAKDGDTRNVAGIADCAEPGMAEILRLPESIERRLQQSSEAQARRDVALNEIVPQFKAWDAPAISGDVDAEIQAVRKLRPEFIAESRLHRVCWMMKRADYVVPEWLEKWRKQDKMDWQEASHVALRARNQRKNFYRETAKRLAREYAAIVIEKPDLKAAAELVNDETGEKTEMAKKARTGRVVAGIYELDQAVRQAFEKEGGAILEMNGENTASTCSICGGATEAVKELPDTVCCRDCGAILNRKQNGAANAWQLAHEIIEEKTAEYHLEARRESMEKLEKRREKLGKMAEKRKQNQMESKEEQAVA